MIARVARVTNGHPVPHARATNRPRRARRIAPRRAAPRRAGRTQESHAFWGQGIARALPTRVRRAALATLAPRTMKGHCTSEKPPFLRRQPVLPHASPPSHCARWLARVACLPASALTLSGDEAQHVRFRRACAPRRAGDTRSMQLERALHERKAAVPSAPGPCSRMPVIPLTLRGGLLA